MERGDIYLITLDPTLEHEQQGTRPVFIISPKIFNIKTNMPIVLPITTKGNYARNLGFAVHLAGGKTTGIIRCEQPRVLDFEAKKAIFIESAHQDIIDEVMLRLKTILF